MIYRFVSKDGNTIRIGDFDVAPLEVKLQEYLDGGYTLAEAEAFDAQIIKGATAGMIPDPALPASSSDVDPDCPPSDTV